MPKHKSCCHAKTVEHHPVEAKVCPDQHLYRAAVHFLGRKAPTPSVDGLESIQKPLCEMYSACSCVHVMKRDMPGDAYLVVMTSGLFVIPVNPLDQKIWIRMQDFRGCGAVKGVGSDYTPAGVYSLTFMPIDTSQAKTSPLPAVFTVLASRGGCLPLVDCFAFSCPSEEIAISLATFTKTAFMNRSGWSTSNKPPCINILDLDGCSKCPKEEIESCEEFVNPELYKRPPLNGYFYASGPGMIKSYDLGVEAEAVPLPMPEPPPEPAPPEHHHHQCLIISQDLPSPQTYYYTREPEIVQKPPPNVYISVDQFTDSNSKPNDAQNVKISYDKFIARQDDTKQSTKPAGTFNMVDLHQWINGQEVTPQTREWINGKEVTPSVQIPPTTTVAAPTISSSSVTVPTVAPSTNSLVQTSANQYPMFFMTIPQGNLVPPGMYPDYMPITNSNPVPPGMYTDYMTTTNSNPVPPGMYTDYMPPTIYMPADYMPATATK